MPGYEMELDQLRYMRRHVQGRAHVTRLPTAEGMHAALLEVVQDGGDELRADVTEGRSEDGGKAGVPLNVLGGIARRGRERANQQPEVRPCSPAYELRGELVRCPLALEGRWCLQKGLELRAPICGGLFSC